VRSNLEASRIKWSRQQRAAAQIQLFEMGYGRGSPERRCEIVRGSSETAVPRTSDRGLKEGVNAKGEARNAENSAREEIKNAGF